MPTLFKTGWIITIKTSCFCWLLLTLFNVNAYSQRKINATLFAGFSNYSGDLQEKRFTLNQANAALGIGLNYEVLPKLFATAAFKVGKVSASDEFSSKPDNRNRNLNFYSNITEFAAGAEYHVRDLYDARFTPFVSLGLAVMKFNPHADGVRNLRNYSTEGQGFIGGKDPYKLTVLTVPFGGGVKYRLTDNIHIGYELVIRKTFTDYIDDVSTTYADENLLRQNRGELAVEVAYRTDEIIPGTPYPSPGTVRGSPKSKDWYYFSGFTLSFGIGDGEGSLFKRKSKYGIMGCPKF